MGFFDFFKDRDQKSEAAEPKEIIKADEAVLATVPQNEIEAYKAKARRSARKKTASNLGGLVDELIPIAVAGVDAVHQYGMAVVKFPEGVGWADLCKFKAGENEGWNLLSNFMDGKFNDLAAIKQAGLQPTAVANLAMQGAAVAVGAAYMAQISDQLEGIENGIEDIKRELQQERDAKLLSSFSMLQRYAQRFDEYSSNPEKKQAALIGIEQSLRDASEIWHFQIESMKHLHLEIASSKRMKESQVIEYSDHLRKMEARSAAAFQLCSAVSQLSMRYDDDFSSSRILTERDDLQRLTEEYSAIRGAVYGVLSKKAMKVGGAPFALADAAEKKYDGKNPVLGLAHGAGSNLARVNPVRMRKAGKQNLSDKRSSLINEITADSPMRDVSRHQLETLEELDFMYNRADAMAFEGDNIIFLEFDSDGDGDKVAV